MSRRSLAKRRENPETAAVLLTGAAGLVAGAGIGALAFGNVDNGLILAGGSGLVAAAVSQKYRELGLTVAGFNLAGLLLRGAARQLQSNNPPPQGQK